MIGVQMSRVYKGPFEVVSSRHIYTNPWITVREDVVVRPGGTNSVFGVVDLMAGSSILALTDECEVYLAKEYKYGLQNYSIETVSGGVEAGETPLQTAIRELREEFGLEAREWINLGTIYPFTNVINSASHLFLALGVAVKYDPKPDPGEHIETLKLPLEQVVDMVMRGEIVNGSACTLILKAYHYLRSKQETVALNRSCCDGANP